ncbi:MAG: autotransporter, partial [Caulobacteraceae bacterium]|nr:autotransporter [Caulobacteraceae bacterium]
TGGGVRVGGSVAASSYGADATGLRIGGGASVPAIHNDGTISAGVVAEGLASAQAVLIDVGANAPLLQNAGAITATLSGEKGDAVAILDRSGTLAIIDNIHTISAAILPNDDANDTDDADTSASNELVTGKAVAIDVSANTSGVYVRQYDSSGGISPPSITGAIRLGAGADRMDVLGGSVRGDVAFGAGANALTIDGGATVTGAITAQGGTLALTVRSGSLSIVNTGALALSSLDLTAASNLVVTVDPASGAVTTLDVAGVAHIESGAKIGLNLTSLLKGSATYTIIRADSLTAGVIDQSLLGETPYLYTSALSASPVAGTVTLSLARKSADQLGLPAATRSAYEPMVAAIDRDSGLRGAMLGETGRAGFLGAYNQLLPNHSGAIFQLLAASAEANSGPIDERRGPDGGAWAQELNYRLQGDGGADVPGYRAWGLGLVGGYERVLPGLGVVGLTVGLNSGQVDPKGSADNQKLTVNMMEGGGYWRATWGGFSANARVAGDYLHVASDRVVSVSDGGVPFVGQADGRWNGLAVTSRAQAGYEAFLGPVYLRPQVAVDYLRLREGGYAEQGSSAALNLTVDSRTSSQLSAFAGLALGALFGEERNWGPELLVGYRRVANETLGSTQARFTSGGDSFVLGADEVGGQGFAAHLSFRGENGFGGFAVQSGAEMRDGLAVYDFRLSAHLLF